MVSVDVLVVVVDFGLLVVLVELTTVDVDVGFKWLEEL